MGKSLFEQMGGTYTQVGDYMLPFQEKNRDLSEYEDSGTQDT